MVRLRIDPGYIRALRRLDPQTRPRVNVALERFMMDPDHPGLGFEALFNALSGYYTIRVNRPIRILLRKEIDAIGELYAVVDVGNHDAIYRRR